MTATLTQPTMPVHATVPHNPTDSWGVLPVGVDLIGDAVTVDLARGGHLVAIGRTGTERGAILGAAVAGALDKGHQVFAVDLSGRLFRSDGLAQRGIDSARTKEAAATALESATLEMRRRREVLAVRGVTDWRGAGFKPVLVVIDEYLTAAEISGDPLRAAEAGLAHRLRSSVEWIAAAGPSIGIHLALGVSRMDPQVFDPAMRSQFGNMACTLRPATRPSRSELALWLDPVGAAELKSLDTASRGGLLAATPGQPVQLVRLRTD